ncbi:DUF2953 domain-containing protein [Brotaphodocola sp.]|uniref:DUF2953 domain-containing protein n=1 Tax=Brotaphodocola sp. TaxID=3073577 RepID=UPI003D7CB8DE
MLAVIFGILKILGLLILGILGLILLVLCLVLFVPICYRAEVSLYETFQAEAAVSWLFQAISLTVRRRETTEISLRIFGRPLGNRKKAETAQVSEEESKPSEQVQKHAEKSRESKTGTASETVKRLKEEKEPKKLEKSRETKKPEEPEKPEERSTEQEGKKSEVPGESKQKKIGSFFKKIPEKIKVFWKKIKKRFGGIRKRLAGIGSNLQELNEKRKRLMDFLRREENKRVFRLLKRQVFWFFRHVFPQKLSGKLRFGLGDPYLTGKVLTVISPFYGFYGKTFAITPVFEAEELVLEGETKLKGRIRIGTLLWIGLRILIDKDARRLWKTWRNSRR